MAQLIRCYTLFDITYTGIANRHRPPNMEVADWINKRNTQCNFDTILQVISLRSQPDVIENPIKRPIGSEYLNMFGLCYASVAVKLEGWSFVFEVQHSSVFENEISKFGALYNDCSGVPMITKNETYILTPFLDITEEQRNIYFEEL